MRQCLRGEGIKSHQRTEGGCFHFALTTVSLPSFLKSGLSPKQRDLTMPTFSQDFSLIHC